MSTLKSTEEISSAIYLQVSIISQALIFVTRSQSWSFMERPGALLMCAFVVAQLVRFMQIDSTPARRFTCTVFFNLFFFTDLQGMSVKMPV